jgi:predicted acyl esterase
LFTAVCLPAAKGNYPTVIFRSPYVDYAEELTEDEIVSQLAETHKSFIENGYVVVYQHCRGRGKSSGDCVPYIYEREDGLFLQQWVREQSFYNGEIYLCGNSYTASVHFVSAPFADDIKGAVLNVQDCERYNCNYRNGFYKIGLHGGWYVKMYKKKSIFVKNYVPETYNMLPLSNFSKTVFGERAEDFDETLLHPNINDEFWQTRYGGGEAHNAIKHANIPILLTTGFYDIYTGGVFDMWNGLDEQTKAKSSLIVHPYDHGCNPNKQPIQFENATLFEKFGDYQVKWLNAIRNKEKSFVEKGKITYYKLFGNQWQTDDFKQPIKEKTFTLGQGEKTYVYNPYAPATFKGGLSTNFGGNAWQDKPNSRYDLISVFTPEFEEDTFIKGKMKAKLCVKSDCEDTCFYVRISLVKEEGYYGLRDDINQISNFRKTYKPNQEIEMEFSFDEHAFIVKKGEKLRIDISSSAFPLYVCHTNNKGLFSEQTTAKIAKNTLILDKSYLTVSYE